MHRLYNVLKSFFSVFSFLYILDPLQTEGICFIIPILGFTVTVAVGGQQQGYRRRPCKQGRVCPVSVGLKIIMQLNSVFLKKKIAFA